MKLLLFGDVHWSSYSSLVRGRGEKYSQRLEHLVNTMNWIEQLGHDNQVDYIICLGDFFDKADLNAEELTALQEINWVNIPHLFLVGNHEMGRSNLQLSSSHILNLCPNVEVIDKPQRWEFPDGTELCFLPYILEQDRRTLKSYFSEASSNCVVLSHNDISGMHLGKFTSVDGFKLEEISTFCKSFINGHLHNQTKIGNLLNLGNVIGQNFSEDASTYRHQAMIYSATDNKVEMKENPHSFNFYKLDYTTYTDCEKDVSEIFNELRSCGPNAVVTIKCTPDIDFILKDLLSTMDNIIHYRLVVELVRALSSGAVVSSISTNDHIDKFIHYVKQNIGTDEIVIEELSKVVSQE